MSSTSCGNSQERSWKRISLYPLKERSVSMTRYIVLSCSEEDFHRLESFLSTKTRTSVHSTLQCWGGVYDTTEGSWPLEISVKLFTPGEGLQETLQRGSGGFEIVVRPGK